MTTSVEKKRVADHGIICRLPGERFSYFGWPTVARMPDGTLVVVSSGLRSQHVCPVGKTVLNSVATTAWMVTSATHQRLNSPMAACSPSAIRKPR